MQGLRGGTSGKHALVIGIDDYRNGIPALTSAVSDARAIAEVLEQEHGYRVTLLLDAQASLAGIRAALGAIVGAAKQRDRVVFYFAGHGIAEDAEAGDDGPRGYFIPQDADKQRTTSFLAMDEVRVTLAQQHVHHLLLLLDCCFAGSFQWSSTRDLRVRKPKLFKERYDRYVREPAWQAIASSACDERALDVVAGKVLGERAAEHSPFAAACIEALRGAGDLGIGGRSGDGVIVASELYLVLEEAFFRYEQITGRRQQTPSLWSFGGPSRAKGQFIFELRGADPSRLPSALELNEASNPYRGLSPYGESSAGLFFGREAATRALLETVQRQAVTVVVGASGTGKSSLVAAGLLPRLRGSAEPAYTILAPQRPESAPQAALERLVEQLEMPRGTSLADAVAAFHAREPQAHLVVVIDQLEELVTQTSDAAIRGTFLRALADAAERGGGWLHVVMTLRLDFEAHFSDLLAASDGRAPRFLIPHLSREELRLVIEGPATERVLFFEPPELVDALIDEVIDAPGALPLLSFTLSEMYRVYVQRARDDRTLREEDYESLGGVSGALARRADEVYARLAAEAERTTMRRLLLRMVVPGESARRPVLESELRFSDEAENTRVRSVCAQLVDARLASSGKDALGRGFVEPAHDKLVTGWPLLQTFIDADRDRMVLMHALGQAAAQWAAGGRASGLLWDDDPRRPQVLALRQAEPTRFNVLEEEFVARSQQRRKRFWITVLSAVGVTIVGLSVLAGIALYQRNQAVAAQDVAEERRVAAEKAQGEAEDQKKLAQAQAQAAREATRLAVAGRALSEGRVAEAQAMLRETMSRTPSRELSGWWSSVIAALKSAGTEVAVFTGHEDGIDDVAFSPDGTRIVTASYDGTARVWDAATGRALAVLKGHSGAVNRARFSPDGARIVTASGDNTARIWDAATGNELVPLVGHGDRVRSVMFSPDGAQVVTGSWDKTARVWDASTGKEVSVLAGHKERVFSAEFSPDGQQVVTASLDETARIWDAATGKEVKAFKRHRGSVLTATFSPDGTRVLTSSVDTLAMIWEVKSGDSIVLGHLDMVEEAAFSPDGTMVVTMSSDRIAKVWSASTGAELATLAGHQYSLTSVAFSRDGRHVLTASDGTVRVWSAVDGKQLMTFGGNLGEVTTASFSPDGSRVVAGSLNRTARVWRMDPGLSLFSIGPPDRRDVSARFMRDGARVITASNSGEMKIWDALTGKELVAMEGHEWPVRSLSLDRDGSRMISASHDGSAKIWDVATGRQTATIEGFFESARFSPDGAKVLTTGSGGDAHLWDSATGSSLTPLGGHTRPIEATTFSPDGTRLVTGAEDKTARVWDTATGQELLLLPHDGAVHVALFDPEGGRIATGASSLARVWDAGTGAEINTLQASSLVASMVFSPDGAQLVTGAMDGMLQIWDVETGQELAAITGHANSVLSVAFSPDGGRMVTASEDQTARVWDVASRKELATLSGHHSKVVGAEFSRDGSRILTYAEQGPARVWWGLPPGDDVGALRLLWRATPYCPTPAERAALLGVDGETAAAETGACEAMVTCAGRQPDDSDRFEACLAEYRKARATM